MYLITEELTILKSTVTENMSQTGGTNVTDITHYLDEAGELMQMPGQARKLGSFLTLLIEAATDAPAGH